MEYVGFGQARMSPEEPDGFLIPANATTTKPPPFDGSTQICLFTSSGWAISNRANVQSLDNYIALDPTRMVSPNILPPPTVTDSANGKAYTIVTENGVLNAAEN